MSTQAAYQDAYEDIVDRAMFQVYYRQLGIIALHFGVASTFAACQYLTKSRGGKVSWFVPGAVGQWDGLQVTPGYADSPMMSLWFFGSAYLQKNTVFVRKGWWTLYLPEAVAQPVIQFSPKQHLRAPLGGKVLAAQQVRKGKAALPIQAIQVAPATEDRGKSLSEYNRMSFLKVR